MTRPLILATAVVVLCLARPGLAADATKPPALDEAAAKLSDWNASHAERQAAMDTLRNGGPRAVEHIRALLKSRVWPARHAALTLASNVGAPGLEEMLATALEDKNWSVRAHAAAVAENVGAGKRAKLRAVLTKALDDRFVAVRLAAYKTLAKWEAEAEIIARALSDADPEVSYWAARNYMQGDRAQKLTPDAKARLADSILTRFRTSGWRNLEAVGVVTLLSLGPGAHDALYEAVANETDDVRERAVSSLGSMAGKAGLGLMSQFLDDPQSRVRRTAMRNICRHCDEKYAPKLLDILKSTTDSNVRYYALQALGRLKYKKAIPYLLQMVSQSDQHSSRQAAFSALAKMGDRSVVPALMRLYRTERRSWQRRQMIDPIARLLGHEAVQFLTEAIRDEDNSVRIQALYAVRSRLKEEDKTAVLIQVIKEEDNDKVRQTAIRSLPDPKTDEQIQVLILALKQGGPESRKAAAHTLARSKLPRAAKAVINACRTEEDPEVRAGIIGALGQLQDKQAVPFLKKALNSPDASVRAAALAALSGRFADALTDGQLIRLVMREDDERVLRSCVGLIGRRNIRDPRLLPRLSKLMESGDANLRLRAITCVTRIEGAGAVGILCKAIKEDSHSRVRSIATDALIARLAAKTIPARMLVEPLGEALEVTDAGVRQRIVSALAQQADRELAPVLLKLLKNDTTPSVRRAAAEGIKRIADKKMVPALLEAAKAEERADTLVVLIGVLSEIGDRKALPFFRDALRAAEPSVQAAAMRAIGAFKEASLVPFYVERFKRSTSAEVRLASLHNIKGTADRRALDVLLRAFKDEDARVRRAALAALVDFSDAEVAAALAEELCGEGIRNVSTEYIIDVLAKARSRATADKLLEAARTVHDRRTLERVYRALARMGERRAAPLLADVVKENAFEGLTRTAIQGLANLDAREHAALCLDVARNSMGGLSDAAASAAARLGAEQGFRLFADRFRDGTDHEKRFYAPLLAAAGGGERPETLFREALAATEDESLIATLCSALPAGSRTNAELVRQIALGGSGPEAITGAIRFFGKASQKEAAALLEAIAASSRPASMRAAALLELTRLYTGAPVAPHRMPSIELARRLIHSNEPELKRAAVEALGMHGYESDAEALIPLAEQREDGLLRAAAVRALGATRHSKEAEAALLKMLGEPEEGAPLAAVAQALGSLRSTAAAEKLAPLAESAELSIRLAAVEALGRIGSPPAIKAVEKAFEQKDIDPVRAAAARALGRTARQDYVRRLMEALKTAPGLDVRAACAEALGRIGGDDARAALIEALKEDSGLVRESAVRALGAMKAKEAAVQIQRMLDDTDVRVASGAKEVLAELSNEQ